MRPHDDSLRGLAIHVAGIDPAQLPPEAIETARRMLLNTLGVIVAASGTVDAARRLAELAQEAGGRAESSVLGFGGRLPAISAGHVNGALAHCLHFDDLHPDGGGHLGAAIVPAALALAEARGSGGLDLMAAIAAGSDVLCRLAMATAGGPAHWSPHPTLGVFGAAAACARLLALDSDGVADALGVASTRAAGTLQMVHEDRSPMRDLCLSLPGEVGVRAALLAERGITGVDQCLEGPHGLFEVYYEGYWDRERLTGGLGARYPATAVGFKPWPSITFGHPHIDASLTLRREHRLDPANVREVVVFVGDFLADTFCEPEADRRHPTDTAGALYSIPFSVAVALAHGRLPLASFLSAGLRDPEVLSMAERIRHQRDPAYDVANIAAGVPPGRVEIMMNDGAHHALEQGVAYGDPRRPMSWEDLVEKFRDCVSHSAQPLAGADVDRVIELIADLEAVDDVGEISRLLAPTDDC